MEINKRQVAVFFALITVVTLILSPVSAVEGTSADRTLPGDSIEAGTEFEVTLDLSNYGELGQVTETLPDGFIYVSSTGAFNTEVDDNQIIFTVMGSDSITYTLEASETAGTHEFMGSITNEDKESSEITGDTEVSIVVDGNENGNENGVDDSTTSGSGSVNTGEKTENIVHKDVKSKYITKGESVSYDFNDTENAINYVRFNALKNSGDISTTIEVLNDTSELVGDEPPGTVYRNVNVWVGKTGFATPQNIENPVIDFRVEKIWIENNNIDESDITLLRFNGSKWSPLTTQKINEDENYIYFESETPGFSPFAITAMSTEEKSNVSGSDEPTSSNDDEQAMETNESSNSLTDETNTNSSTGNTTNPNSIPGFEALIAIGLILLVYYIKRK